MQPAWICAGRCKFPTFHATSAAWSAEVKEISKTRSGSWRTMKSRPSSWKMTPPSAKRFSRSNPNSVPSSAIPRHRRLRNCLRSANKVICPSGGSRDFSASRHWIRCIGARQIAHRAAAGKIRKSPHFPILELAASILALRDEFIIIRHLNYLLSLALFRLRVAAPAISQEMETHPSTRRTRPHNSTVLPRHAIPVSSPHRNRTPAFTRPRHLRSGARW